MNATPADICRRALLLIGAISQTDPMGADDAADAYATLTEMLDGWRADRLAILVVERATFTLTAGTQLYTIGTGGTLNRDRPLWLDRASVIVTNNPLQPLELPIQVFQVDDWQQIPVKSLTSTIIQGVYYDYAYSAGLGHIYVWPIPTVGTSQLVLYCPTPITAFTSSTTSYDFPPAYLRAIRYNLAVELAPEYAVPLNPVVVSKAAEYLGDIRRTNIHPVRTRVDDALISRGDMWNWRTGMPF